MFVKKIHYTSRFIKKLKKLPAHIIELTINKEKVFKSNPLHPSLRLHELHGKLKDKWSITISGNYRIIFERMENGDILFISAGKHDIYRYL